MNHHDKTVPLNQNEHANYKWHWPDRLEDVG